MYKLKQELPKEFKIKVNPKQSKALQKHLFSIGYSFGLNNDIDISSKYLFIEGLRITHSFTNDFNFFKNDKLHKIKFKDYFEKETSFPEKWCILVTHDNYKELNAWMHRNWKNYQNYTDIWKVCIKSIGDYFSNKQSSYGGHSYIDFKEASIANCELITTEQFRQHFGDLKPNNNVIKDSQVLLSEIKSLLNMVEKLTKLNDELNDKSNKYYKEVLMLTEKLETIKKVLE
jgi:hypothetical protein